MKINGSLIFDASSSSEIQNLRVQKVSSNPTHGAADVGRLIYNTTDNTIYIGGASAWVALATGGNAAALQLEVDAIETSLGSMVDSDGVFQGSVFQSMNSTIWPTAPTSLSNALDKLADYVSGADTLAELKDVNLSTVSNGQYLKYDSGSSKWVNDTLTLSDVTDVTASAAEVNVLDGITASTTELNYVAGVTSGIQGQLDGKQAADATLSALSGLNGTGFIVENGVDTFTYRSLTAPAAGFTISNADGVSGNPTFALANDLAALEGLATNGIIVRTGDGLATTRSVTGSASRIVVTNGDGVSGSPTVDLATVTDAGGGAFKKFSIDSYGRVTGTSDVVTSDITALVDSTYVNVAGDTMGGDLNMGTHKITGLGAPTLSSDAVNKAYADALVAGLSWKDAVRVATTANIDLSLAPASIDGVTLASGDRVLVKDQSTAAQNGIYVFNGSGSAMTRATDMDSGDEFDGAAVFVMEGTQAGSGWTETATVATVDTSAVVFSQFTGGALYTWGTGLSASGNTINVNLGAGIAQLPSDEVGIDVVSNLALQLTDTTTSGQLTFVLDSGSGLSQSSSGLKIAAAGVTNAMLLHSTITLDADDASTGSIALGDTLSIFGNATQGISSSISGGAYTLTMADASASQKGVATFNASDFDVTSGNVTIKAGGVDNAQLANSTVSFMGDSGTSVSTSLGGTFNVFGSGAISTVSGSGNVTISVAEATASVKGVASFSSTDFTVTSGAVSLVGKALDSLTDVTVTSATAGDMLVNNGSGQFINRKVYFLYTSGAAATSHTVTHNLGQKFCNVTVVDSSDEVVIPQSIKFDSSSQLTVTFNTAIDCKVIVMGV